jgi:hypothetical protein
MDVHDESTRKTLMASVIVVECDRNTESKVIWRMSQVEMREFPQPSWLPTTLLDVQLGSGDARVPSAFMAGSGFQLSSSTPHGTIRARGHSGVPPERPPPMDGGLHWPPHCLFLCVLGTSGPFRSYRVHLMRTIDFTASPSPSQSSWLTTTLLDAKLGSEDARVLSAFAAAHNPVGRSTWCE